MHKLILGIIAIICLDIGFAAYMANDQTASVAVKKSDAEANPITISSNNLNETSLPVGDSLITAGVQSESVKVENPVLYSANTHQPRINKFSRSLVAGRRKNMAEVGFRVSKKSGKPPIGVILPYPPVVIALKKHSEIKFNKEYAGGMLTETKSSISQPEPKTLPRSRKKSFFGTALKVLKKPFDWTMAIGSRLR